MRKRKWLWYVFSLTHPIDFLVCPCLGHSADILCSPSRSWREILSQFYVSRPTCELTQWALCALNLDYLFVLEPAGCVGGYRGVEFFKAYCMKQWKILVSMHLCLLSVLLMMQKIIWNCQLIVWRITLTLELTERGNMFSGMVGDCMFSVGVGDLGNAWKLDPHVKCNLFT